MSALNVLSSEELNCSRLENLSKNFSAYFSEVNSIAVINGQEDENAIKMKTSACHYYLFGKEIPNSIVLISNGKVWALGDATLFKLLSPLK